MKISRFLLFRGIYLKENKGIGNVNRGQQVPYGIFPVSHRSCR